MIASLPTTIDGLTVLVSQLLKRAQELETDNSALRKRLGELEIANGVLKKNIVELEKKLAKNKIDPPPVIRPQTPVSSNQHRRKQRADAFVRKLSTPDQIVIHAYTHCPHCQTPVCGNSLAYEREVIDLPAVIKPVVTLHKVLKRHCTQCGRWLTPKVDLSHLVIGHSRIGVTIMSVVTTLREYGRLPVRVVQRLLLALYGLSLSLGEIIGLSHQVASRGSPTYQQLHTKLLTASCINADETSHRENGQSGYVWNFTTPLIRYYAYRLTRSGTVVDDVLGVEFQGLLTTDFYAAYSHLACPHQRCWAHLLRDVKKLLLVYPEQMDLPTIGKKVRQFFQKARKIQHKMLTLSERHQARRKLETKLLRFVTPYLKQREHPFHTLAKRIDYFLEELFTFILDPSFSPTNNAAERAVRHQVIKRKISGGTRSAKGSRTQEVLTTLFSTWTLNNLNPLTECQKLLTTPDYATKFVQEL